MPLQSAWPDRPSIWLTCGLDAHVLAVDLHVRGAGHQVRAARAADLEAGKDDVVARVRRHRLQVVQHAARRWPCRWRRSRPWASGELREPLRLLRRSAPASRRRSASSASRAAMRSRRRCRRYNAVAVRAIGLSSTIGRSCGISPALLAGAAAPAAAPARGPPRTTAATRCRRAARCRGSPRRAGPARPRRDACGCRRSTPPAARRRAPPALGAGIRMSSLRPRSPENTSDQAIAVQRSPRWRPADGPPA